MSRRDRTWLVPEVLQTSLMDCGPAALKAVLEGYRIPINLERLRERCQTDVDGTSINALEEVAERLGLETEQIMVPTDNLLLPGADVTPSIIFLTNPDDTLHFVVLWSIVGPYVQLMDPGRGRIWMHRRAFANIVAALTVPVPADEWREWATGEDFLGPLAKKLRAVGADDERIAALVARANEIPGTAGFAALDASTRFVSSLVTDGALPRAPTTAGFLEKLFVSEASAAVSERKVPQPFWTCSPPDQAGNVRSAGAILLHFLRRKPEAAHAADERADEHARPHGHPLHVAADRGLSRELPDSVVKELSAPSIKPHRIFARMLMDDSTAGVMMLGGLVALGVGTGLLDAIMMRGLATAVGTLSLPLQRVAAIVAVTLFLVVAFGIDVAAAAITQRLARGLESRLRVAFLAKLPRLDDRYFRSRSTSDMAARAHILYTLRNVPTFAITLGSAALNVLVTTGVLVWLEPRLKWIALGLLVVTVTLPVVAYRMLDEGLARLRNHAAALSKFYFDALVGVLPIRVHGAERAVRREHEGLLTEWVRTGRRIEMTSLGIFAVQACVSTLVSVALVASFVLRGGDLRALLLLALFAQRLPMFAETLVRTVRSYPLLKHDALRLFEPLTASSSDVTPPDVPESPRGVEIELRDVHATANGRDLLAAVTLQVPAGTHAAIVGPSGAGKSSLVSVLLGWLGVTRGEVLVDGERLDDVSIARLRTITAWVDPAVQLWNATLFENLMYGHADDALDDVEPTLEDADLLDVVERLPGGLQGQLGESGVCVSGGQGQRVRLARAMLKRKARLVILDEPFRGVEREKRRAYLEAARRVWPTATILYVSHDVADTVDMDQVVVVRDATVVESGAPRDLLAGDSVFRSMVEADRAARARVWGRDEWRHLSFEPDGLREEAAE